MFINYCLKFLVLLCGLVLWVDVAVSNDRLNSKLPESLSVSEDPHALLSQAIKYEHAEGVKRNRSKAIELYCRAAKLGYAEAQYALGWIYTNGRGVSRDDWIATHLFSLAAEQGHIQAQNVLQLIPEPSESALPTCLQPDSDDIYPDGPIHRLVKELAPHYKVDPSLVMAVISVESAFNVEAISSRNAQGLMQLIPETAARFQVENAFDAEDNIRGGMAYLRWLLAFFKGDVALVAAAYNAGEGAVEKYRGIPPYPETRNYVKKIKKRYKKSVHPYQPSIVNRHSFIKLSANDNKQPRGKTTGY